MTQQGQADMAVQCLRAAVFSSMPRALLFPGLAVVAAVLAGNYFGDWLKRSLDPKLRRVNLRP